MSWYDTRLKYTWWEKTGNRTLKAIFVISPLILSGIIMIVVTAFDAGSGIRIITMTLFFISTAITALIPTVLRVEHVTMNNSHYYLNKWFKSPFNRYVYPFLIKTQEDDIGRSIAWVALIEYNSKIQEYKVDLSDSDLFILSDRILKKATSEEIEKQNLNSLMAKVLLEEDCFEHFHKIDRSWKKF